MNSIQDIVARVTALLPAPADLHSPDLSTLEKEKVAECLASTFVSSVGAFTNKVEETLCKITGSPYAIVTGTGTSALHLGLHVLNVGPNDLVLCPALTFVATANAILYTGAHPLFVDSETETLGVCPVKLEKFLSTQCEMQAGACVHKTSGKKIKALCLVHIFGFAAKLTEIQTLCQKFNLHLVEDTAEAIGTFYKNKHVGTSGVLGTLSFNGNKIVTAGGGGAILVSDPALAKKIKHLSTTAKVVPADKVSFAHDEMGFNYRMPNLNAALLYAQLLRLEDFLAKKEKLHQKYVAAFADCQHAHILHAQPDTRANYWLNTLVLKDGRTQKEILQTLVQQGIQVRPPWDLMSELPYLKDFIKADDLEGAKSLRERVINLPSSSHQKTK